MSAPPDWGTRLTAIYVVHLTYIVFTAYFVVTFHICAHIFHFGSGTLVGSVQYVPTATPYVLLLVCLQCSIYVNYAVHLNDILLSSLDCIILLLATSQALIGRANPVDCWQSSLGVCSSSSRVQKGKLVDCCFIVVFLNNYCTRLFLTFIFF
jgi:hypothetical protein